MHKYYHIEGSDIVTQHLDLFQQRVFDLAQKQLNQAAFDFYVVEAQFIAIDNNILTVYLDHPGKEIFWQEHLEDIIQMAGFEILNTKIDTHYIFTLEHLNLSQVPNTPITPNLQPQLSAVESNLNTKYTFENFIQGRENQFAFVAAYTVAEKPGGIYNPLFIWGGPGLGKTHLLNAIGNKVLADNPTARVKYITAENFVNQFVTNIRSQSMEKLVEEFRTLDVLLIDDIQFLARKTKTQEEFFYTFDALYRDGKQIVLTSDRTPTQLNDLQERLVTRFQWGLIQDITPPDFETRIAILGDKIQDYQLEFQSDTIEYLAAQFDSSIRDLEGAIKDINLVANFKHTNIITVDIAAEAIRSRKIDPKMQTAIPIEDIQNEVAQFYGVTVKEIKATRRTQNIVLARQVAMYLARELTDNSLPKIGKEFGGRDHTTVLHAYKKVENMITQDDSLRIEIESIKNKLR